MGRKSNAQKEFEKVSKEDRFARKKEEMKNVVEYAKTSGDKKLILPSNKNLYQEFLDLRENKHYSSKDAVNWLIDNYKDKNQKEVEAFEEAVKKFPKKYRDSKENNSR